MKPAFLAPRELLERKPAHGAPCTRCGLCCMATLCDLAQYVFQRERLPGPCPALVRDDDGYACGMTQIADPAMRDAALLLIGGGLGCDARFNGEPASQDFYKQLRQHDAANADAISAARKLWQMI